MLAIVKVAERGRAARGQDGPHSGRAIASTRVMDGTAQRIDVEQLVHIAHVHEELPATTQAHGVGGDQSTKFLAKHIVHVPSMRRLDGVRTFRRRVGAQEQVRVKGHVDQSNVVGGQLGRRQACSGMQRLARAGMRPLALQYDGADGHGPVQSEAVAHHLQFVVHCACGAGISMYMYQVWATLVHDSKRGHAYSGRYRGARCRPK